MVHVNETPLVAAFATPGTGDALIARHVTAVIARQEPEVRVIDGHAHFVIREQLRGLERICWRWEPARGARRPSFSAALHVTCLADSTCDVLVAPPPAPWIPSRGGKVGLRPRRGPFDFDQA